MSSPDTERILQTYCLDQAYAVCNLNFFHAVFYYVLEGHSSLHDYRIRLAEFEYRFK